MATKTVAKKVILTSIQRNFVDIENVIINSVGKKDNQQDFINLFKSNLHDVGLDLNKPFKIVKLKSQTLASALKEIDVSTEQKIYFFSFKGGKFVICNATKAKVVKDIQIPLRTYSAYRYASFGSRAGLDRHIRCGEVYALVVDNSQTLEMDKCIDERPYNNSRDRVILNLLADRTTRVLNADEFAPLSVYNYFYFENRVFQFRSTSMTFKGFRSVTNTIEKPYLDKSGYVLETHHNNLRKRLEAYKNKVRMERICNSGQLQQIKKEVANIFLKLAMDIELNSDFNDVSEISWTIRTLIDEYQTVNKRITDKSYYQYNTGLESHISSILCNIKDVKTVLGIVDEEQTENTLVP